MNKHQNKIEKLISELCPKGVKFFEIGEICEISRGRVMSKDYLTANKGEYPVYSSQTTNEGIFGNINTHDYDGEYVTWTTDGANAGSVFYRNRKFSITNVCGLLKSRGKELNARYLSYVLGTKAKSYVNAGMGNPKLMSNVMAKIKIPVPPLAIQEEIVRILNSFTELEAELEARRKQYEHYRSELLTFDDMGGVQWVPISELCLVTQNIKWTENKERQFKYIDLSSVDREKHMIMETININNKTAPSRAQKIVKTRDIIFGTTRPMLKRFCIIPNEYNEQICSTGFCVLRPNTEKVLTNYLYYQLGLPNFYKYVEDKQKGASYPAIADSAVKDYKIPLPEISEQKRIVTILDKFDALVNDISIGLPAELKARRSQYEYYRGRLLTFNEYAS